MRAPVAYALSRPSALARARTHAPTRCHSLLAPGASTTARVRRKPAPSTPGIAGYAGAGHVDFAREHAFAADLAREGAIDAGGHGEAHAPLAAGPPPSAIVTRWPESTSRTRHARPIPPLCVAVLPYWRSRRLWALYTTPLARIRQLLLTLEFIHFGQ
ncbi:hypothetical protein AURDEDRAFT_172108 [Auricularia subglabra TFB-10046 SS5]|nr:hypothetical protein AURDEDRAFT_172108 [Auricularia subglabra TFB-10046 SS5]